MNQCDGCRRGLPVDHAGHHHGEGAWDIQACTAYRYATEIFNKYFSEETHRMIKPRNSLVVVRLIEKAEHRVGAITVPANNDCYTEAEVIAVGPGSVSAEGGRSETFDLHPGQRVWVKHKKKLSNGSMVRMEDEGLPYRDGETLYHCFEQNSVIGILAQPGESTPEPASPLIVN